MLSVAQYPRLDKPNALPDDAAVALHDSIRQAMVDNGVSNRELAARLGIDESVVSRLLSGQVANVTVGRVVAIEAALGCVTGFLFRAAGLVTDDETVRQRIESDPLIDERDRAALLLLYDVAVERRAGSAPRKSAPAKSSKRVK